MVQKTSLVEQVITDKINDNPSDVYANYERDYRSVGVIGSERRVMITEETTDGDPTGRYFVDDDKHDKFYAVIDGKLVETDGLYSERGKTLGLISTARVLAKIALGTPFKPHEVPIDMRKYPKTQLTMTMNSAIAHSGGRMPTTVMTGIGGSARGTNLDPR